MVRNSPQRCCPNARALVALELRIPVDLLDVQDPNELPAYAPFMANQFLPRIGGPSAAAPVRLSKPATGEKVAGIIGPAIFVLVGQLTGSRWGITSVTLLLSSVRRCCGA